ncbi:unnamed protein product [Amoebophrya sp. A25]|nr:unnamed protein product [Amoebophrya sp. A25]|eukprot:GSA25T00015959001.1
MRTTNTSSLYTAFWDANSEDNDAAMRQLLSGRGQKALAAIHAASSAGQNAMALAVNMAQETNLAANLANQAQAYLERYVYGRPMSALPANVAPEPPAITAPPREVALHGLNEGAVVAASVILSKLICKETDSDRPGGRLCSYDCLHEGRLKECTHEDKETGSDGRRRRRRKKQSARMEDVEDAREDDDVEVDAIVEKKKYILERHVISHVRRRGSSGSTIMLYENNLSSRTTRTLFPEEELTPNKSSLFF